VTIPPPSPLDRYDDEEEGEDESADDIGTAELEMCEKSPKRSYDEN